MTNSFVKNGKKLHVHRSLQERVIAKKEKIAAWKQRKQEYFQWVAGELEGADLEFELTDSSIRIPSLSIVIEPTNNEKFSMTMNGKKMTRTVQGEERDLFVSRQNTLDVLATIIADMD